MVKLRRSRPRIFAEIEEQPEILSRLPAQNHQALTAARELVRQHVSAKRQVLLLGMGSSLHVAEYGARVIEQYFGAHTASVLDVPASGSSPTEWTADDLVIVVSQSGQTSAVVDTCKAAHQAGATIISVTNDPASPLSELSDINIDCRAGTETVVAATKSVTAQALALRALAAELTQQEIDDLVNAMRVALTVDVSKLRNNAVKAVVAGGTFGKSIAEEIALKYVETSGEAPIGEVSADFLHGPIALRGKILLFTLPEDGNAKLIAQRAGVITVGGNDSSNQPDISIPELDDRSLDAIVKLLVGQRAAAVRGQRFFGNPDKPKGLSKVTRSL